MPTKVSYVDGWVGDEVEVTVVPPPRFPFRYNPIRPDTFTREYAREFDVLPLNFLSALPNRTTWANVVTRSETIAHADWTKTNVTATDANAVAPDGNTTMAKLLESSATGEHSITQAATVTAAPWEFSVFVKGGLTRTFLRLAFIDSAAVTRYAYFCFGSAFVGTTSGVTAKLVALGDGYFRCVIQCTPAAGAGTFKVNIASSGSSISYAGNTADGLYLWGAQATLGAETPYVSTTTVARTVSAPDRDPVDPLSLLIGEDDLNLFSSERARIRRTFGRIPLTQTVPDSIWVKKPKLPGTFPQVSGDSIIIQPDANVEQWIFYTYKEVTVDSGFGNGALIAGAFTLTVNSQTTAPLAYSANAASVQNALNALSGVSGRGGVVVTGPVGGPFVVTFNSYAIPTINTSGLTVSAGTLSSSAVNNGPLTGFSVLATAVPVVGQTITGGTFTLSFFGQTTAPIAYNASLATAAAAINLLSEVIARGGVTVLGNGTATTVGTSASVFIRVTFASFGLITGDSATTIIPIGTTISNTVLQPSFNQSQRLTFDIASTSARTFSTYPVAHGITAGDGIVILVDDAFFLIAPGYFTVSDAYIIAITSTAGGAFTAAALATAIGKQTGNVYSADPKLTQVLRITEFYLIGWTPGIATVADIPQPLYQGDPASLLQAIQAGSTAINYEVGNLRPYKDGPVIERERTVLNTTLL